MEPPTGHLRSFPVTVAVTNTVIIKFHHIQKFNGVFFIFRGGFLWFTKSLCTLLKCYPSNFLLLQDSINSALYNGTSFFAESIGLIDILK